MKTLTSDVRDVLTQDARAHWDSTHLVFAVYERNGLVLSDEQKKIIGRLPKPESVVRLRAKFGFGNKHRKGTKS